MSVSACCAKSRIIRIHQIFWLALSVCSASALANTASSLSANQCGLVFGAEGPTSQDAQRIRREVRSLQELATPDPESNLAVKHPWIVMNAFQRFKALIDKYPPVKVLEPGLGGRMVNMYPLFHTPLPENGGQVIVGQYQGVQAFVDWIVAAANGSSSANKFLVLVGPSGTGKSRCVTNLLTSLNWNASWAPASYLYNLEWFDLKDIPGTEAIVKVKYGPGRVFEREDPVLSQVFQSPITLLPRGIQKMVLGMASNSAAEQANVTPRPLLEPNPQNERLRDLVLDYYAQKLSKTEPFSDEDVIHYLSKHVRLRRHTFATAGNSVIEAQTGDPDWASLIGKKIPGLGHNSDPLAWDLSGAISRNEGGIVVFDETLRNVEPILNAVLTMAEGHKISRGALTIPLDTPVFGATNFENIEKANEEGQALKAFLDRSQQVPFMPSTDPSEVLATTLMMLTQESGNLTQRSLVDQDLEGDLNPSKPLNIGEVLPLRKSKSDPYWQAERRYALSYSTGPRTPDIEIAPWALSLMTYVAAASRMETNPAKIRTYTDALKVVVRTPLFQNPVYRLKAMLGLVDYTEAQAQEIRSVSGQLKEGTSGISPRSVANIWLPAALAEAGRRGGTLTPRLVREVFQKLLKEDGEFKTENAAGEVRLLAIMDSVIADIIVPEIERDINSGMGSGMTNLEVVYDRILLELSTLGDNKTLKVVTTADNRTEPIDFDRLEKVAEAFNKTARRQLELSHIATFELANAQNRERERVYHPNLMEAIRTYYAGMALSQANLAAIMEFHLTHTGSAEVQRHYSSLVGYMHKKLGYNAEALYDAMVLYRERQAMIGQPETKPE